VEWGFQACSGAWTDDVLTTGQWGDPLAQLAVDRAADTGNVNDLPVDADTDLVTITVGGNDVRFSDVLNFCALSDNCTTENYHGQPLAQYNRQQRDMLSPRLDEVYRQIHAQAPDARILVLGYPQLFPASSAEQNCWKIGQRRVIWRVDGRIVRSIGFSRTEQNYLRQAASELNQLIAARVEASGLATFVPVDHYFAGHEVCGNSAEWINAPTLSRPRERVITVNDQAFHPNERGHRHGYAAAINDVMNPG
jgi:lysophospholipase L1-like esterase